MHDRDTHLMEADDGHRNCPEALPEVFSDVQLLWTELVIAIQDARLNNGLDQPPYHLLGGPLVTVVRVTGQSVKVVEKSRRRVVDKR